MSEQTREYRAGKTSVYLTRFGQAGLASYAEVMTRKQTAAALAARLGSHRPATADDALGLRFALLGVEMARTATGTATSAERDRAALLTALAALEDATLTPPAAPVAVAQPTTCRHGVAFTASCPACDED